MKLFTSVVFRLVIFLVVFRGITNTHLYAQPVSPSPTVEFGLDKGLRINAPDSSVGLRIGFRLQSQFHSTISLEEEQYRTEATQTRTMIRRARLLLKGYLLREEFTYFVNVQFDKGRTEISDAYLRWHPNDVHTFGVGQFRVFDERQFRIPSAYLQFVERSVVSNEFTQGYDIGVFWNGSWVPRDDVGLKLYLSATHGEWKNVPTKSGGFLYTSRAELLPLGAFSAGGDYRGGGIDLQPDPKLSIGVAASLNKDAHLFFGSDVFNDPRHIPSQSDVTSLFGDILFKYRHFSFMGEITWRELEYDQKQLVNGIWVLPDKFFGGYGIFFQAGTMVAPNLEFNARYETLQPGDDSDIEQQVNMREDRYSLGLTRYLHKHCLKIQAVITLANEFNEWQDKHEQYLESRLQFQVNF